MVSHSFKGVRRSSYPSGPWVDEHGRPARSPNYEPPSYTPPKNVDPSPTNWKILEAFEENGWLIIKINYPGCPNYEGNKIIVYKGITLLQLINNKSIDPHFLGTGLDPVARFAPTKLGWDLALKLIRT